MELIDIAATFLLALVTLGAFDGIYFHLYKLKLYKWPATKREHLIHSLRAVLLPAAIYLLFAHNFSGPMLWLAVGVTGLDLLIQQIDLIEEKRARQQFGGLSSAEYSIHVWATGLHVLVLGLVLLSKPPGAFHWASPAMLSPASTYAANVAWFLLPGSMIVALMHFALMIPRVQDTVERLGKPKPVGV